MQKLTAIFVLASLTCVGQNENPVKVGLGIVAIRDTYNESGVLTIYKDEDLATKLEDFKLYSPLKNVWPYAFKPDYGLCQFICLEKTKDYFKILINDREEGFLKNDEDKYFKTWEALLINATVERLDVKANPLRSGPSVNAETIAYDREITIQTLEVIDVVEVTGEHWINVRFSKTNTFPCKQGTQDCGVAWIKWRSGDKLLINILMLC
jgi:hypothetical protein